MCVCMYCIYVHDYTPVSIYLSYIYVIYIYTRLVFLCIDFSLFSSFPTTRKLKGSTPGTPPSAGTWTLPSGAMEG